MAYVTDINAVPNRYAITGSCRCNGLGDRFATYEFPILASNQAGSRKQHIDQFEVFISIVFSPAPAAGQPPVV